MAVSWILADGLGDCAPRSRCATAGGAAETRVGAVSMAHRFRSPRWLRRYQVQRCQPSRHDPRVQRRTTKSPTIQKGRSLGSWSAIRCVCAW